MGVSAETKAIDPDLVASLSGGDAFFQRMAELKAANETADASLAQLNLGKKANVAYADATAKLAQAQNALEDANAGAVDILARAQKSASQTIAGAQAKADGILAQAAKEVQSSQDEVKAARVLADELLTTASATKAKADEILVLNTAVQTELDIKQAELDKAIADNAAMRGDLEKRAAAFNSAAQAASSVALK